MLGCGHIRRRSTVDDDTTRQLACIRQIYRLFDVWDKNDESRAYLLSPHAKAELLDGRLEHVRELVNFAFGEGEKPEERPMPAVD